MLLAASLAAASCANVYVASTPSKEPVNDLLLLEPVSMIRYIDDSGLGIVDDSLCRESSEMISAAILSRPEYFRATEDAILLSDATEDLIEFYNVIAQMKQYLRPGLTVPPSIKKII